MTRTMTTPYTTIDFTIHLPVTLTISTHELALRQLNRPSLLAELQLANLLTSHLLASLPTFPWSATVYPPEITSFYEPPEPNEPPARDANPQSVIQSCSHESTYPLDANFDVPLLHTLLGRTCPACALAWIELQEATIPDDCRRYAFDPEATLLGKEIDNYQAELADITRTSWWIWFNSREFLGHNDVEARSLMTLKPARWWSESYRNRPETIYEALKNTKSWR